MRLVGRKQSFSTKKIRIAYALGDGGFNLVWVLFETFGIYFYVESFGLAPSTITLILLVARTVDLSFGLLFGFWIDRVAVRSGIYRTVLLWTAVPLGVAALCVFTGPRASPVFLASHWNQTTTAAWATLACILFVLLYSAANIAYTALLSVITNDEAERTRAVSARFTVAAFSVLVVQFWTLPLVSRLGRGNAAWGWQRTAMLYGCVASLLLLVCFAGTRQIVPSFERSLPKPSSIRALMKDRLFQRLILVMILSLAGFSCRGSITPFYTTYNAGHAEWTSLILVSNSLAALCVCGAAVVLPREWLSPGRITVLCAAAGTALCCYPLRPRETLTTLIAVQVAFGAATGMMVPALFSLFAEIPARLRSLNAGQTAGLIASVSLLALKAGSTLGSVLVSSLLGRLGFIAGSAQSPAVLSGTRMLFTYLPAGLFLACAFLLLKSASEQVFPSEE